ncbi:MAG: tRNA uracil 4-sulfurtransferase ThiI [Cellvibrionaceae bacterium]
MHFVVKYFPEITIKSPPVRKRFIKQLQRNIRKILRRIYPTVEIVKGWDKIEVLGKDFDQFDRERVADVLACTPGIAYFAESTVFEFDTLENLASKVNDIWLPKIEGKSFSVRAKRQGKQGFGSMDVERLVGSVLNRACESASVNLSNPDVVVKLEIVDNQCFVLLNQRQGLGGYPLGTQDDVLSLVSGGFDSTVASYLTNKRGLATHFCFFNLGGRAHELGVKEVSYYLWHKYASSHNVKFISVPFEDVVTEIIEHVHNSQMGVILKRMMLRVATKVAADFGIKALVTGEAIAQVSSQTLTNLSVIDSVTETLVLRPLITMDKGDIISLSRKIGTEEFAANMPEYCGVISVKPTTRATHERIDREEASFNWDVLERAYQASQIVPINAVANDLQENVTEVKETGSLENAVIIDIRHPTEEEKQPLSLASTTLKKIPFYQLSTRFPSLDKGVQYLLYCDRGVMSKLHAAHLSDAGYSNVGVYRPES